MKKLLRLLPILLFPLLAASCASTRGVSVGSDEPTYSVQVTNNTNRTMTVSWTEGGDQRVLGEVGAGKSERFIIAGARSNTVSIRGVGSGGMISGPYPLSLVSGETQRVTLR